ncbi:hypothetical protein ACH4VR_20040 [Streptomyces sp. NPDC020883]|uniref:recombination directionality factor n=1 Tax=Streptomyces sp. NPDC020883 TaxID=3365099 RepID=UPI0037919252
MPGSSSTAAPSPWRRGGSRPVTRRWVRPWRKLYGGTPQPWETTKEDSLEVLTDTDSVKVIVDGPDAISFRMALYGVAGRPTHACDGVEFTEPEDPRRGQPSGCPATVQERKAAAEAGHGPKPDQRIEFRLADAPELGKFRLMTGSWDFMKSLESLWRELEAVGGPALCSLGLELVEFTTKSGVDVAYRKPVLKVLAPPRTRSRPPVAGHGHRGIRPVLITPGPVVGQPTTGPGPPLPRHDRGETHGEAWPHSRLHRPEIREGETLVYTARQGNGVPMVEATVLRTYTENYNGRILPMLKVKPTGNESGWVKRSTFRGKKRWRGARGRDDPGRGVGRCSTCSWSWWLSPWRCSSSAVSLGSC